ncbi:hypothetical protein C8Q75DRAFT_219955 [Abortiporus biennis]|nr:hypothetical protein C8Q75DRAFT_219955 [Abortiporus biennis]
MTAMSPTKVRSILYYIIAFLSVVDIGCSLRSSFFTDQWTGNTHAIDFMNIGAAIVALVQLIWVLILLAYNNDPFNQNILCRASTHFASAIVFACAWFGSGTINAVIAPYACDKFFGLELARCVPEIIEAIVAWVMFALSVFLAVHIFIVSKRYTPGLKTNIATAMMEPEARVHVWVEGSQDPVTLRDNAKQAKGLVYDDDATLISTPVIENCRL